MKCTFTFNTPITKQYLLSKYSDEDYMSFYLQRHIDKKLFRSPLRKDKNPTCSFYRNKSGELIFHDFATGQHLNFIGVVQEMYHLNYGASLKLIARDFNLGNFDICAHKFLGNHPTVKTEGPANIRVEIQDFTKKDLDWWESLGISEEILKKYKVFSCKNVFLNNNIVTFNGNLTFGYYGGKINNIELWRIYYPNRKSYRFLTNWPSKKIQGFDQLPKYGKLLVITKSMKDVMSMSSFNITACSPNSETQFLSDSVLEQLKSRFKHIIVMYDNDKPGKYNMFKIRKRHPELNYFCIPKGYAKDFTDTYKLLGRKKMISCIKQVLEYFKKKWT